MTAGSRQAIGRDGAADPEHLSGTSGAAALGGPSDPVRDAVERASRRLLELQSEAGWWRPERVAGVAPDAEDLLFREFVRLRTGEVTAATAGWIRSRQLADGSWAAGRRRRGSLSASVQAYCALRLAGDQPDDYHLAMAAGWIRDAGGLTAAGAPARIWLALFGQADWDELLVPPPEAVYLPASCPVRLAGVDGWGRPTVLPLAVIAAVRPRRALPFSLDELHGPAAGAPARPSAQLASVTGRTWIGKALRAHRRTLEIQPLSVVRAAALQACADSIIEAQQPDGSWRASRSGWLFSLMALHLLGYALDHPVVARGVAGLDRAAAWTEQDGGPVRRLDSDRPAARDTALAVTALTDAGLPPDHPRLVAAGSWLVAEEISAKAGRLAGQQDAIAAGLGAGAGPADLAGVAETAAVLLALRRVRLPDESGQLSAAACALRWLPGVQGKDGGWGRFATAPGSTLVARLPVFGVGGARAAASAELTGYALQAMSAVGQPGSRAIRHGVIWLLRGQLPDGAWAGDQDTGGLMATCAALSALAAAGVVTTRPPVTRAAGWLAQQQNADGGWGHRELASDGQVADARRSAPVPTAMVVMTLLAVLAAGGADPAGSVERGIRWLAAAQLPDGSWADPADGDPADGDPASAHQGSADARDIELLTAPLSALGRYQAVAVAPVAPAPRCGGPVPALSQDPVAG